MMKSLIAATSVLGLFGAVPVAAQPGQSVSIDHRDLNLATPEGQSVLEARINHAARRICGMDQMATGSRIRPSEANQCYREARAQAKQQLPAAIAAQQRGG